MAGEGGRKAEILSGKTTIGENYITVPTARFNAFYILLQCYHQMFESGLGLRQLIDYYFVLKNTCDKDREYAVQLFEQLGIMRFAKAVMRIMLEVFGLKDKYLLCESDEKEGRFILNEAMQNGNFEHHDARVKRVGSGKMDSLFTNIQHNWHLATLRCSSGLPYVWCIIGF